MNPKTCLTKVNGKSVAFVHVPKTGGQSIQRALKMGLRRHAPVSESPRAREVLSCDYAFAFVRNPYTRAVSLFHWLAQLHLADIKRRPENAALNQWARNTDVNSFWMQVDVDYLNKQTTGNMFRTQSWFLCMSDGKVHPRLDIHRFEDFASGWQRAQTKIGKLIELPHVNKSTHGGVRDELLPDTRERIAQIYALDFLNFYPEDRAT